MDSIYYILIAYIAGSITTYIIMRGMIKFMRKSNSHLRSESDYYFMMGKLFYKTLSSEQQKEVDEGRELRMIRAQHRQNIEKIKRTGKY